MPWKECSVVDGRLRFVAQLVDGEPMAEACRAFGISRNTGYKIFQRYKEHGLEALNDRSRRPVRYAQALRTRLLKNRERLFTFLEHDGVPWNNNAAENAIRRFAYFRDAAALLTREEGLKDYLVLLSLFQTCRYKAAERPRSTQNLDKCPIERYTASYWGV
jgi:transposase